MPLLRHDLLRKLHEVYQPRTYFEIGVEYGRSLALSRVPTIAVDPAFKVVSEITCDLQLVKATSDAFFLRDDPFEHFGGAPVDLAFIDGMHRFEFALRDFINVERYTDWTSVIVFDDVLPRGIDEAARDRHTRDWTGDVYKILPVLQRYRADLVTIIVDTQPTGTLVVLGADSGNTVLAAKYDEILHDYVVDDPQQVPADILQRRCALDPHTVVEAPFWSALRTARDDPGTGDLDRWQLHAAVERSLELKATARVGGWRPEQRPRRTGFRGSFRLPADWQRALRQWVHRARG
jgi:hypothetical protein